MDTSTRTLLFTAELVEEDGSYALLVRDLRRGTVQTTAVPKAMVDKLPTFLSALAAKLAPPPQRRRW
ncbi:MULTISPECIES: hypothetical protein [Streptomycetaceae]|uniref:hypothetical protein n=1 Tax=Streptomycetaceae TaxID=2062 RepID=UPI00300A817A